ncbi:hypothetical protein V8C42DRAFT_333892 [Trichoderma barbatum]
MIFAIIFVFIDYDDSKEFFSPKLSETTVVFRQDPIFGAEQSLESDEAWDNLLPDGHGFVLVESPERYGLKQGIPTELGVDRYSVSMFHQLHCLGMLRESLFAGMQHRKPNISAEEHLDGHQLHTAHQQHVRHCFDYLRQSIMCCGDMSLEWARPSLPTVDGWDIPHRCKSFDEAVAWTLQHRAPHEKTGIA